MNVVRKTLAAGVIGLTSISATFNNAAMPQILEASAKPIVMQNFVPAPDPLTQEQAVQNALTDFNQNFTSRVRNKDYSHPWNGCFTTKTASYDPAKIKPLRLSAPINYDEYAEAFKILIGQDTAPSSYSTLGVSSFFPKQPEIMPALVYNKPIIILDPGHGQSYGRKYEPGSLDASGSFHEVTAIDAIIVPLKQQLERELGAVVVLTREPVNEGITLRASDSKFDNQQFALQKRAEIASLLYDQFPDAKKIFVSIHADSAGEYTLNSGGAVFYYDGRSGAVSESSKDLAKNITQHYSLRSGTSTQLKADDFAVLRCQYKEMPAVLVELGFLSNPQDLATFKQAVRYESNASQIAHGLFKGIAAHLDNDKPRPIQSPQMASLDVS